MEVKVATGVPSRRMPAYRKIASADESGTNCKGSTGLSLRILSAAAESAFDCAATASCTRSTTAVWRSASSAVRRHGVAAGLSLTRALACCNRCRMGIALSLPHRFRRWLVIKLSCLPQLSDLVRASSRMRQACAFSDTTFILEACPREFQACGSPAVWQTGRRSWLFPLMPPPPCR